MANNSILGDIEKKLDRIKNYIAEEVASEVHKLYKESVSWSLVDWYNDYDPKMYQRTNNFMNVISSARTSGKGNILTMTVDSDGMSSYSGFDIPPYKGYKRESLSANAAFDFMFMNGEHGHGRWMMHRSLPPYMYVDRDVSTGWDGRLDKIVNNKIGQILRR